MSKQKQNEYSFEQKKRIVLQLKAAPRGSQKQLAKVLSLSTRTLRQWKKSCNGEPRRPGRKRQKISFSNIRAIAREWEKQGRPGSRPLIAALPQLRVKEIRQIVAELKARTSRRHRRIKLNVRTSVVINDAGIVGAMDAATIQRGEDFIVYRDRASLSVSTLSCKGHTDSDDSLGILQSLKEENKLPFVLCTDNGSPFCSDALAGFLKENKVIQLNSLPRVPQHNGSAENAVCEIRQLLDQDYDLNEACRILNEHRLRGKLAWKTACEAEKEKLKPYTMEDRERFYEATCKAIEKATLDKISPYEIRKAKREAIFQTLERFSFITRTTGQLTPSPKAANIS